MIKPFDEDFEKTLVVEFGLYSKRNYNDYAFDQPNNLSLLTQICLMAYNQPEIFAGFKSFLDEYLVTEYSDPYVAAMAYTRYAETEFDNGVKYISSLLEQNPSNIDVWIELCFFMAHLSYGYETYLNMRFHLYYFMQMYHKYDFHTVSRDSFTILNKIIEKISETPAVRRGYEKSVNFDTEYLFLNGRCNNNCIVCHIPEQLKRYDFEDRITKPGFLALSKYIYYKARRKRTKHFVLKGGEPTLHPNYFKILEIIAAVRPDILLHVQTNARTFCNKTFMDKHAGAGVSNIIFEAGLFSADASVHDGISMVPGSHSQTVQGINSILDQGMKVSARIVLCDENINGLAGAMDFVLEKFGSREGFMGIEVLLPPPSARNIGVYYPDGIVRLRDAARETLTGYAGRDKCPAAIANETLADGA
jgi:hypothetical protein